MTSVPDWKKKQLEEEERKKVNQLAEEKAKQEKIAFLGLAPTGVSPV